MFNAEELNERRLEREAQQCLGVLRHPDAKLDGNDSAAKVEVYDPEADRAGYFKVIVPSIDPDGLTDDEALAVHPATLAYDVVSGRDDDWEVTDVSAF